MSTPAQAANNMRVHASRQRPVKRVGGNAPLHHTCQECGASVGAHRDHSAFCGNQCRNTFNNRNKSRGAEIMPLLMTWRYDRKRGKEINIYSKICAMLKSMRDEDHDRRESRHSWPPIKPHLDARPHRFAKVFYTRKGTRRK